jgi:hypothetical protein|tara:strand:- start:147 stop:425 length:279 start_codon:yes stop_codon:yes gene_type:complete
MSKKIQETTQRDIDQAFRSICEILNEICIDDIKQLLEECYESRNKETSLDVDITDSEEEQEEDNNTNVDSNSNISEDDYQSRMDNIDNETIF